jgi:hypothetical protein
MLDALLTYTLDELGWKFNASSLPYTPNLPYSATL